MISQLGPYLIDEALAEGGMARVFRARLRGLGGFEKTLVLKQIRPELAKDPRFVEMFVREANTLVQMSHPHIVPVYELGAVDGTYYLSMEFIEGATLSQILDDGPLAPALAAQIGVQIGDALDYAHGRVGILHRDITPRNLIVDEAGHVRLLDFGIAAALDVGAEQFGSPGYMAPEQVRGEPPKPASDLFSLGVVLFEALTGKPPFEKTTHGSLAPAPKLGDQKSLPRELAQIVDRMLEPRIEDRPRSADEVTRALRGWLAHNEPGGVFEALRARAEQARARIQVKAKPTTPAFQTESHADAKGTTPIEARRAPTEPARSHAFATSPVLTQMLRTASGAPRPMPPDDPAPGTRPITRPIVREEPATNVQATAFMLRAWPWFGLLALGVLGVLSLTRPQAEPRAEPLAEPRAERAANTTPPVSKAPELAEEPALPVPRPADAGTSSQKPPEPVAAPEGRAVLSISAVPWAEVSLDGRALGTTPLRKLRTKSGSHVLVFECPPLGKRARVSLALEADADARVVVDLTADPPRTSLDGATELR